MIRIWVPRDTADLWRQTRSVILRRAGRNVLAWECLSVVLESFLGLWDDPGQVILPTEHAILDWDGYQCTAPGCSARRGLEVHHIIRRSRGGSHRPGNRTTLCAPHHRHVLHARWMSCRGNAPGGLTWELGLGTDRAPLVTYRGDVLA